MKRSLSESDDCDDVFSEESSKEQCSSPGDADSCQMLSRKKRRGIIEKRRRDRINTSLTELRRLVPSAYEKQGSAKLEKAEILQLTVDHLKMLHAKGMDALAYDPHKFAMDYHNIGFRECAAEVARYLVTVEGMDIQDPLRLRLMSHLQCFAAQRELATKQATAAAAAATATPWGSYGAPAPGGPPPPPPPAGAPQPFHAPSPAAGGLHPQASAAAGDGGSSGLHPPPPAFDVAASSQCSNATPPSTAVTSTAASAAQSRLAQGQPPPSALTPLASPAYPAAQYHMNLNAFPAGPAGLGHHLQQGGAYGPAGASAQRTPYRPWGAELAY